MGFGSSDTSKEYIISPKPKDSEMRAFEDDGSSPKTRFSLSNPNVRDSQGRR
jgi:hypothetical protein